MVVSKEIKQVLDDLRSNEEWFYRCFALWLGTGLRNVDVIGLTWDCVRLDEGELLILQKAGEYGLRVCIEGRDFLRTSFERQVTLHQSFLGSGRSGL